MKIPPVRTGENRMIIKSIDLADYRNYGSMKLEFDSGTNILYGDNAQGKTNILEAIFVAATTKSHKGSKDREIIQFDKNAWGSPAAAPPPPG